MDDIWTEKPRKHDEAWRELEAEVQSRSLSKDSRFVLSGRWKQFYRQHGPFTVYLVDSHWVKHNLSIVFGHGGHGFVHEFIPLNEIWVSRYHAYCDCKNVVEGQPCSIAFIESTLHHEITEFQWMECGVPFHEAHRRALQRERELGYLKDPYVDPGQEG